MKTRTLLDFTSVIQVCHVLKIKGEKVTHHDGIDGCNDAPQEDEAYHRQTRDGVQGQAGGV